MTENRSESYRPDDHDPLAAAGASRGVSGFGSVRTGANMGYRTTGYRVTGKPRRRLVVIGTRPEAIKLAPLVHCLAAVPGSEIEVCATGQHRDLLRPVLDFFGVKADHDLAVGTAAQTPLDVSCRVTEGVAGLLDRGDFDQVIVQGDTSSALGGGLAAFYRRVGLVHVEAGLRSGDPALPFPEEGHRRLLDVLAEHLFVPTELAAENLRREGVPAERIHITGNTGIDALRLARDELAARPRELPLPLAAGERLVLLTTHRREHFGRPLERILEGVRELVRRRPEVRVLFPVHPNPQVRGAVRSILGNTPGICLADPLDYPTFVQAMLRSDLILTDSGGVQEEGATLGKRLLVLRESTERPEGLADAGVRLVGTDAEALLAAALDMLNLPPAPHPVPRICYGDGRACERIRDRLLAAESHSHDRAVPYLPERRSA